MIVLYKSSQNLSTIRGKQAHILDSEEYKQHEAARHLSDEQIDFAVVINEYQAWILA